MPYFSQAPLTIAREEGYFTEQGIDAEFLAFGRTNSAETAALVSGELDVATGLPRIAEFAAIGRGAPIRYVADKGHFAAGECPSGAFVIRKDLADADGRISANRLRGERIRLIQLSYVEFLFEKTVRPAGLTASDFRISTIPMSVTVEALRRRDIALSYLSEVDLRRAIDDGVAVSWKTLADLGPPIQFSSLLFGSRLIARNRDLGVRVLAAYLKGVRRYNEGKTPRNVASIARLLHRDPGDVRKACWPGIRSDGRIIAPDWMEYQAWAVARRQLARAIPLDRLIDTELLQEANRRLDAAGRR